MARNEDPKGTREKQPANVTHGSLRYVRSQRHLMGLDRTGARGGRDDVHAIEQETWQGRADEMRAMHAPVGDVGDVGDGGDGGDVGRSDERVREAVHELLTVDDFVDASAITIEVSEGVVALSGTVATRDQRVAAEDTAWGVEGVVDVINQLRVIPREVQAPFER